MAKIIIQLPQITNLELTIPDNKLADVAKYYGVQQDDYATPKDAIEAFRDQLVHLIKQPLIKGRRREIATPDITDLIT